MKFVGCLGQYYLWLAAGEIMVRGEVKHPSSLEKFNCNISYLIKMTLPKILRRESS